MECRQIPAYSEIPNNRPPKTSRLTIDFSCRITPKTNLTYAKSLLSHMALAAASTRALEMSCMQA